MNSNPKTGFSITGIFIGHRTQKNGQYQNDFIGIQTAEVQGDYGQLEQVVQDIEVYGDSLTYILANAKSMIGKPVRVWFYQKCMFGVKNARPWGFVKNSIVKGSVPELLDKPVVGTAPLAKAV